MLLVEWVTPTKPLCTDRDANNGRLTHGCLGIFCVLFTCLTMDVLALLKGRGNSLADSHRYRFRYLK